MRFFLIISIYLIAFGAFLKPCIAVDFKDSKIELEQGNSILRSFFEKDLVGTEKLDGLIPEVWMQKDFDSRESIAKLQAELNFFRLKEKLSPTDKSYVELLNLKLQWLSLSKEELFGLIQEANSKAQAQQNSKLGEKKLEEAHEQLRISERKESQLDREILKAESQREEDLLKRRLQIEKDFQQLQKEEKNLGLIRQSFSQEIQVWAELQSELSHSFEDESFQPKSQSFSDLRDNIRDRLAASNSRVKSKNDFRGFIFSNSDKSNFDRPKVSLVQVRDQDSAKIRDLIHEIQSKRIDLESARKLLSSEQRTFFFERVVWEKAYRSELLRDRGRLIERLVGQDELSPESLWFEVQCVWASTAFRFWSWNILSKQKEEETIQARWQQVGQALQVIKLLFFSLLISLLLLKRKKVLKAVRSWFHKKVFSYRRRRWIDWGLEVFGSLYVFLVLILLGNILIDVVVEFGFGEAVYFRPYLEMFLIYFFSFGLIEFVSPFVSQRKLRYSSKQEEVFAMERTFEFVPKLFLTIWLVDELVFNFFYQFLDQNLIYPTLHQIILVFGFFGLFVGVWLERKSWRLVSEKATDSVNWQTILKRSEAKVWEPFVLLFGGGLGVYLLAWKILKDRLSQLEVTRSFQAMLSRALIERKKTKSLFRVVQDQFPANYLESFDVQKEASPEFYIDRKDMDTALMDALDRWKSRRSGANVLIVGDRGIGKSEIVRNFLRTHNLSSISVKLSPGGSSLESVCRCLAAQLLQGEDCQDVQGLIEKVSAMPASIISFENVENSILRTVGGFEALSFLIDLLTRTSGHHLWLTSFTTYAWTIAKSAVPGANCFSHHLYVEGMSEEEIKSMVLKRHEFAKASRLDFSDFAINQKMESALSNEEAEEKRKNLYFRILWDYSEGNPRRALYFWKTSLVWNGDVAKVSLFDVPEQDTLNGFSLKTLMVIAALVEHNGLTLNDLTLVMNESEASVRRWMQEMSAYGILYSLGDVQSKRESWHVESYWMGAVETYLLKRQLLFRGDLK